MLLIPVRTDAPVRFTPWANYALIGLSVLTFILTLLQRHPDTLLDALQLHGAEPTWYGFITYQFLHANWWHLLGNMLFLWVFGNAVNAKMGNLAYPLFFLAGGVFAGIIFALVNVDPVIGASGSVAAVTAAFVVLYPRAQITLFYWFFILFGMIELPGLILVLVKFVIWDNILTAEKGGEVAYEAHLAGYGFGFVVCFLLLAVKALPRDQFDLFALFQRWRRRREFQEAVEQQAKAVRQTTGQNEGLAGGGAVNTFGVPVARPVQLQVQVREPTPEERAISELREGAAIAAQNHQWEDAVRLYQDLLRLDSAQALPKTAQLDVANHLMQAGQWSAAAEAYTKFLARYPKADNAAQVELVTGLVLARYLHRDEDAEAWLKRALPRLRTGSEERTLAEQLLNEIAQRRTGGTPSAPGPGGTPMLQT